jgi:hypothetical protein
MEQVKVNQVYFTREKKDLTLNIRNRACGAKVYTLQKMPGIVLIILINIETMSRECFSHW